MARKEKDTTDQLAEATVGCLFALLWGLIVAIIALLVKAFQTTPEARLRQLGLPAYWGVTIVGVCCPSCGTMNESEATQCFSCGSRMINPPPPRSDSFLKTLEENEMMAVIFVCISLLLLALVLKLILG